MTIKSESVPRGREKGSISEVASEILADRPQWFERWALFVFILVLLLAVATSWFIRYPYTVQAIATITAANGPKAIVPRVEGKVVRLFAYNDDQVTQGSTLGWIECTANHEEVERLKRMIDSSLVLLQAGKVSEVSDIFIRTFQNLGEIQAPYQQFITALQQFNDYLVNGYYFKRKQVLVDDLRFLKAIHDTTEHQRVLIEQDVQLLQEELDANSSLFKDKVISKQDLRDEKSKLVARQMGLPQVSTSLLSNENQQVDKEKDIEELSHSISQQKIIFQGALKTLESVTDEWISKYTIRAAVSGRLIYFVPLQEGQYVFAGKPLGYINPPDSRYYALVTLSQSNLGRIEVGQKVRLSFDAYPSSEFGYVAGRLSYISKISSDSGFIANIDLSNGLKTNFNKNVQYGNGLKANAIIITKEMRLLQRLYFSILPGDYFAH